MWKALIVAADLANSNAYEASRPWETIQAVLCDHRSTAAWLWTHSGHRRQGVATKIMQMLISAVPGQHIYLQSDKAVGFYNKLGFWKQPEGLAIVSGKYLENATRKF